MCTTPKPLKNSISLGLSMQIPVSQMVPPSHGVITVTPTPMETNFHLFLEAAAGATKKGTVKGRTENVKGRTENDSP